MKELFNTSVEASEKHRQRSICAHEKANVRAIDPTEEDEDQNNFLAEDFNDHAVGKTNEKDTAAKCDNESANGVGKIEKN